MLRSLLRGLRDWVHLLQQSRCGCYEEWRAGLGGELWWAGERGREAPDVECGNILTRDSNHRDWSQWAQVCRYYTPSHPPEIIVIIIMEDIWIWGRDFHIKVLSLPICQSPARLLIRFLLNVCFSEIGPDWMISLLLWILVLLVIVLVGVRQRNIVSCTDYHFS